MRTLVKTLLVFFLAASFIVFPALADEQRPLKVMTRNMDAGTDLAFVLGAPDLAQGVQLTLDEVIASRPALRAEFLAAEIAEQQPDLIALQEVAQWRTGPQGQTAALYDQLELLLNSLATRNLHYAPIAIQTLSDVEAPALATWVHYTDHDVVLARTDLKQSDMAISNLQMHLYQTILPFPITDMLVVPVLHGWISADIKVRGKVIHFVNTHLESTYPTMPELTAFQVAQAQELAQALSTLTGPVVLCGDFNANAEPVGPDQTPVVGIFLAAGFTDVWHALHPSDPGYTWPLFFEDYFALSGSQATPVERIDLIFTREATPLTVVRTGVEPPWASDHAGVAAALTFFK